MKKDSKIYIAGHRGLVGSAVMRQLINENYTNITYQPHCNLDLTNQSEVNTYFDQSRPEYVFLCAARVGGIMANKTNPGLFIYENLMIETNVLHAAMWFGVKKLIYLGSSCIYPRDCPQPIKEEYLLTGPLESTNEAYAIAKIAGVMMCKSYNQEYNTNFIALMPTNLYGPNDNFDLETSHVLPAMIRKFHEAKVNNAPFVELWGTGKVQREFLFVDDLADEMVWIMNNVDATPENYLYNVGSYDEYTIDELAKEIAKVVGYTGQIVYDFNKPDGTPRKLLDTTKLGKARRSETRTPMFYGLQETYRWYLENKCRP